MGEDSQRILGTVTYRSRKIDTYSENYVPNAFLKQSEYEIICVLLRILLLHF